MRKPYLTTITILFTGFLGLFGGIGMSQQVTQTANQTTSSLLATIPFELVNNNIFVKIQIKDAEPLSVIFDTGDKVAIVDTSKAQSLGLDLQGEINVGGAGGGALKGHFVKGTTYKIVGLEGFAQPVVLAIPLDSIAPLAGHAVDGIIGADFISQYVVEIDYQHKQIRLHDKNKFHYTGKGESIPIKLDQAQHPHAQTQIVQTGGKLVECDAVVDLGSGGSITLTKPFVDTNQIKAKNGKTAETVIGAGAGGETRGRIGRVDGLKIGSYQINDPIAIFSEDTKGAMAGGSFQANVGALIMRKFTVFLDYAHSRIILEQNSTFAELMQDDLFGMRLKTEGPKYNIFRVEGTLDGSAAAEAGLQKGDMIVTINGRAAAEFTLSDLHELFKKPDTLTLDIKRGDSDIHITIKPKRLF